MLTLLQAMMKMVSLKIQASVLKPQQSLTLQAPIPMKRSIRLRYVLYTMTWFNLIHRYVETGSSLENANLESTAHLHMEAKNYSKRNMCLPNTRLNYASNITLTSTVLMDSDANLFILSGVSINLMEKTKSRLTIQKSLRKMSTKWCSAFKHLRILTYLNSIQSSKKCIHNLFHLISSIIDLDLVCLLVLPKTRRTVESSLNTKRLKVKNQREVQKRAKLDLQKFFQLIA